MMYGITIPSTNRGRFMVIVSLVLITLVFCYAILQKPYRGIPPSAPEYLTFKKKYEENSWKELPQVAIVPRVWHTYPGKTWKGLQLPVLIWQPMGRLGNVMGEYATLYALGRIYGATVRLHPCMRDELMPIFPNLTMPTLRGHYDSEEFTIVRELTFNNFAKVEAAAAGLLGPDRFLLKGWPFEIQLFNTFRKDILKEFTFSDELQKQIRLFLSKYIKNTSTVLVGFHVRRTDYLKHIKVFKSTIPEDVYYKRATNYYREKFPDVKFVVASDDMKFVKKAFADYDDVIFAPGSPRELDMALLASCNHSIITLGSYGFWTGYLTGGEVVYPDIQTRQDYQFNSEWYKLGHLDFFTPLQPY